MNLPWSSLGPVVQPPAPRGRRSLHRPTAQHTESGPAALGLSVGSGVCDTPLHSRGCRDDPLPVSLQSGGPGSVLSVLIGRVARVPLSF